MEWQDEGIILHTQTLGERKQIVSLFTQSHGRCSGVFCGSSKTKPWIQCGGKMKARWGARLENHIGYWTFEPLSTNTAFLLDAPGPLAALVSAASLCQVALPERNAYPHLYEKFEMLLKDLTSPHWAQSYVFFELVLLEELGYGLSLTTCAVTGTTTGLVAVSPRTGHAVCDAIAKPYQGRLLPLPPFICEKNRETQLDHQEILDALHLTGYFLERNLLGRPLPPARTRLVQQFVNMRKCS
ncbi:MAG: DNA repair protein RecO [Proteobacteria bacterium]|nr:DNA repair protein RecO [Pseudomonadota bacterium]